MARCPYLDFKNSSLSLCLTVTDKYICRLTGSKMDIDSSTVKFICNPDSGYAYESCSVYKSR